MLSDKDELSNRTQAYKVDHGHIHQKMDSVINPLEPSQHQSSSASVHIVTGQVAPVEANVGRAVSIGQTEQEEFERRLAWGVWGKYIQESHNNSSNEEIYQTW